MLDLCKQEGILLEAYFSLGGTDNKKLLENSIVNEVAQKLKKSPAQVMYKYHSLWYFCVNFNSYFTSRIRNSRTQFRQLIIQIQNFTLSKNSNISSITVWLYKSELSVEVTSTFLYVFKETFMTNFTFSFTRCRSTDAIYSHDTLEYESKIQKTV